MNRKFPRYRPFLTFRGFAFLIAVALMSVILGYCAANLFGLIR